MVGRRQYSLNAILRHHEVEGQNQGSSGEAGGAFMVL